MALRCTIQAVEGFRRLRFADEQFLKCRMAPRAHAGQPLESLISIENDTSGADDLQGMVHPIRYRFEQFCFRYAVTQAQEAGYQAQHENNPGHGKQRQEPKHDRFGNAPTPEGKRTKSSGGQKPQHDWNGAKPACAHTGKHSRDCVAQCLDFCHAAEP
ncbi:MAG: hypothetical protein HC869_06875 [Rhodospirillales bacterium]|nr:hypothetical protein [Rhodospirillales bacterium]